ncbi:hypothetical protein RI367_000350 [Sorochytrium milnesiophthora]
MSFPKGARFNEAKLTETPGPGQYDALGALKSDAKHKQFGMMEKGRRFQDIKMEDSGEFYLGHNDGTGMRKQQQQFVAKLARVTSEDSLKSRRENEEQLSALRRQVTDLERALETQTADLQRAETERRQYAKDKSALESERRKRDAEIRQKEEQLALLRDKLEKQDAKLAAFQSVNKDKAALAQNQQRIVREKERAQNEQRAAHEHATKLSDELQHVKTLLEVKAREARQLTDDMQQCVQQIEQFTHQEHQKQQALAEAAKREEQLHTTVAALEQRSQQLTQELAAAADDVQRQASDKAALEQELSRLRADNRALEHKCFEVKSDAETLVRDYSDIESRYRAEIVKLNEEIASLKDNGTQLQRDNERLSAERDAAQTLAQHQKQEALGAQTELDAVKAQYEQQLQAAATAGEGYRVQITELLAAQQQQQQAIASLRSNEAALSSTVASLRAQEQSLTEASQQARLRLDDAMSANATSERRIAAMEASEAVLKQQLEVARQATAEKDAMLSELASHRDRAAKELAEAQQQVEISAMGKASLQAELEQTSAQHATEQTQLREQLQHETKNLQKVIGERDMLMHELKSSRKDYEKLKLEADQYLEVIDESHSRVTALQAEQQQQHVHMQMTARQLAEQQQTIERTQTDLAQQRQAHEALLAQWQQEQRQLQEQLTQKQGVIARQNEEGTRLLKSVEEQAQLLNNHTKLIHSLEEQNNEILQQRQNLEGDIDVLQQANSSLTQTQNDLASQLHDLDALLQKRHHDLRELTAQLGEAKERAAVLQRSYDQETLLREAAEAYGDAIHRVAQSQAELRADALSELADTRALQADDAQAANAYSQALWSVLVSSSQERSDMLLLMLEDHVSSGERLTSAVDDIADLSSSFANALTLQHTAMAAESDGADQLVMDLQLRLIDKYQAECERLERHMTMVHASGDDVKHRAQFRIQEMEHALANASAKISDLQRQLKLATTNYDVKQLNSTIERMKEERAAATKRHAQEAASLQHTNATLSESAKALTGQLARTHDELKREKQKIEAVEFERDSLLSALRSHQDIIRRNENLLSKEMDEFNRISADLIGHNNPQQKIKHVSQLKDQVVRLRDENTKLRKSLENTREINQRLESEVTAYRAQNVPTGSKRHAPIERANLLMSRKKGKENISSAD